MWALVGLATWMVVAVVVGLVIGRGIRIADGRVAGELDPSMLLVPGRPRPARAVRRRRGAIPLPPVGIALVAVAVALETVGFVGRLTGATGTAAEVFSMDAPFSLPRLFVAGVFAAAALAAVSGAGALPGRRTWWLGVGLVSGVIAAVKAGGTVHAEALASLGRAIGGAAAVAVSIGIAAVVLGVLWFVSRTERRDRRRVLGVLALYAVAAVGLSAVSGVAGAYGSTWAATATYVEESGEALAGVALLMAVLAGVAPRLVLPATWPLRRTQDARTLDLPELVPGRTVDRRTTT